MISVREDGVFAFLAASGERKPTPNLPTKIIPAKICWLKYSGKFPMDMGIPPLEIQSESNPPNPES